MEEAVGEALLGADEPKTRASLVQLKETIRSDSYDNALAETIKGLYKAELIHRRAPWKSRESVELATLEWVAWFNHQLLHSSIGYIPPAEAEANYYNQITLADEVVLL